MDHRLRQGRSSHNIVVLFVVLALVAVPAMAQTEGDAAQGRIDGERDGKGNAPLWFGAGCLLATTGFGGPAAILAAFLIKQSPPASSLIGKSPDYVVTYTEAYQEKAAKENAISAGAGCLATYAAFAAYLLVATGVFQSGW